MEGSEILLPVAVLVAWSLFMMFWMVAARLPAMRAKGISLRTAVGGRPGVLDGVIDDKAQWKAHNYIHLMEQPTLFYAIALTLALIGQGDGINAIIAWVYVGLRVIHSLIQATVNIIRYRLIVFLLSTLALVALTVHALIALID
ncbi:MAG: hypothetical protein QOI38_2067 [Sphingomonadales bacterium]|jgi:hypothetical protein|nr:hypothetical protein [Sphingomonadales bacterium]